MFGNTNKLEERHILMKTDVFRQLNNYECRMEQTKSHELYFLGRRTSPV